MGDYVTQSITQIAVSAMSMPYISTFSGYRTPLFPFVEDRFELVNVL